MKSMMSKQTAIVVPCFNEESRLQLDEFRSALDRYEFLSLCFVNDGSRDGTLSVLHGFERSCSGRVTVLSLNENSGKAEAVRHGVLHTVQSIEVQFVGYWDADLATGLGEVVEFLKEFENHPEAEAVLGSRLRILGRQIDRHPMRHYMGRVFATMASTALQLPVYDTQCGAKMFQRGIANKLFSKPFISDWCFDVEILARAIQRFGAEDCLKIVREIPLNSWIDQGGSKLHWYSPVRMAWDLLRIRLTYF